MYEEWIACVLDTEGCLTIHRAKKKIKNKQYIFYEPTVVLTMTSKKFVIVFKERVGTKHKIGKVKKEKPHHKQRWRIVITGLLEIYQLLCDCLNFFIEKKRQAKLLIEFCNSRLSHRYKPYTKKELNIYNKIRRLNKRGE